MSKSKLIPNITPQLTKRQEMDICVIIDHWYLEWKRKICDYDTKTHSLGVAKEQLKAALCDMSFLLEEMENE